MRPDKTPPEISELLKHSAMMRIACEAMAEDIARAWRIHTQQSDAWIDLEERFDMRDVAEMAMFYSEGYGGAFILPRYADNVVPREKLAVQRPVLKRGLLGFEVFAQHQLRAAPNTEKLTQPNGLPMYYEIVALPGVKIHYSWVFPFKGPLKVPNPFHSQAFGLHLALGQSRVDIIYDDFARMVQGHSALSHILVKGNIDVLKIKGLAEALANCDSTEEMMKAIEKLVLQASTTVTGANSFQPMVIDSEETLERKGGNHTGAADIVRELKDMFVAATRIPRTRLLGEQAKGLGNGGEADLTSYYDRCASFRERRLTRLLNWMDNIVAPGKRTKWDYAPLWQLSAGAQSEIDERDAKTAKAYADMGLPGVLDAVYTRLREKGTYPLPAQMPSVEPKPKDPVDAPSD